MTVLFQVTVPIFGWNRDTLRDRGFPGRHPISGTLPE